ncbi:unnamed protein product [Symbiodinium sp. KB8]|nr:unnamed protein product [Symbiodinium sp. KB8]
MFAVEAGGCMDPSPGTGYHEKSPGQGELKSSWKPVATSVILCDGSIDQVARNTPQQEACPQKHLAVSRRRNWACFDFEPGRLSECSIPGLLRLGGDAAPAWSSMEEEASSRVLDFCWDLVAANPAAYAQQRWNRALQLSPKATSDSLTRKGMQIPRVIGKAGAIIKELRQESGANVNILDKQLPEVLQRLQFHVAFVKGSHEAMHTAVVGLVRNARGPQALRALEPTEVGDTDVAFLVPAQCEPYLGEEQLTAETRCAIHVEVMEGLQKHRKVLLRAEETHDLQIVAWRLQELQIRMSQAALLVDRDFDLQDSAWAGAMEAFRAKRTPDGVQAASRQAAVPLERLPTLPSASEGIEQEARKSREAQQREVEAEAERERKRQIRETTAREQQECQNAAREAKMLADKARDMRLRAMEATSADQHQSCIREAERYEEQARQARARSTRGYGTGPRAQQHEYQEDENGIAAVPKVGEDAEAQALRRRHEEREELRRESELRGQQAKENEAKEREVLQRAVSSLAQGGGQVAHRSQGPVASPSTVEDRHARQSEILANSRAAPARALEEASLRPAAAVPPVATNGGGCLHGRPQSQGALSRELQDVALFV